jgi:hypothetical protein
MGYAALSGTTPQKGSSHAVILEKSNFIFFNVSVKMMFRLQPLSTRVLGRKAPSTMGLTNSG